MIATVSPRPTSSAIKASPTRRAFSASCAQVTVLQIPRAFRRRMTFPGLAVARSTSSAGRVLGRGLDSLIADPSGLIPQPFLPPAARAAGADFLLAQVELANILACH